MITVYRMVFSPTAGFLRFLPGYPKPSCIFYPTCSEYGIACYEKHGFLIASAKTMRRIGRCHPGNTPSVDLP